MTRFIQHLNQWVIQSPDGVLSLGTAHHDKEICITRFALGLSIDWTEYEAKGYQCVQVDIAITVK